MKKLVSVRTMKSALGQTEQEVSIKAPWGNIAVLTWGNPASPPVLLCHGKMDTCSSFRPLVMSLHPSLFYVSVDLPGNGHSAHMPRGGLLSPMDFVCTIVKVKEHFKWTKFAFVGHSLGAIIGKYYNIAYPNQITRLVELDPAPAYESFGPDDVGHYYHVFYGWYYNDDKYKKINAGAETAPKYTYQKALDLMMNTRCISKEASEQVLERSLEPAGDGLYRFTYDQRMKEPLRFPFAPDFIYKMYTAANTPILCILAKAVIELGAYKSAPYVMDENAWPNGNYKFKVVEGGHDVHIENPGCMADDISKFLLEELRSKL